MSRTYQYDRFMPIGDSQESRNAWQPPRPEKLLAIIKFLAETTNLVVFTDHASERMVERGIVALDVYRVLRSGQIRGPISKGKRDGEIHCKVAYQIRGSREVGVVVVVVRDQQLVILTAEWEDL